MIHKYPPVANRCQTESMIFVKFIFRPKVRPYLHRQLVPDIKTWNETQIFTVANRCQTYSKEQLKDTSTFPKRKTCDPMPWQHYQNETTENRTLTATQSWPLGFNVASSACNGAVSVLGMKHWVWWRGDYLKHLAILISIVLDGKDSSIKVQSHSRLYKDKMGNTT